MQPDNISLNKAAIVERCIRRMREEYEADITLSSLTHLDALILNIERACQAAIDLAMHIIAVEHLGMPQSSGESFKLLQQAGKVDGILASRLSGMTGFRNIAIHQYQDIEPEIRTRNYPLDYERWLAGSGRVMQGFEFENQTVIFPGGRR